MTHHWSRVLSYAALMSCCSGIVVAQRAVAVQPDAERDAAVRAERLLSRPIAIDLDGVSLKRALDSIAAVGGIKVQYRVTLVESHRSTVSLHETHISLGGAFDQALRGTGLHLVPYKGTLFGVEPVDLSVAAQDSTGTINGVVLDSATGAPVSRATIRIDGTPRVTLSSERGVFALRNLPAGVYSVSIRLIGYRLEMRKVTVVSGTPVTLRVHMPSTATLLANVVTTGAGEQRRVEVGNSIATINADSVVRSTPIRNVSDLLAGRVAGLNVLTSSGTAGAGSKIRIRGASSMLAGEDPVVIVDGVRYNAAYTSAVGGARSAANTGGSTPSTNAATFDVPATSRLDDIDPESIESIDVLKGPAASALYGSDAANGVIVIKTKRGKAGPTRWDATGEAGRSAIHATFADNYYGWGTLTFGGTPSPDNCTITAIATKKCTQDSLSHFNPLNYGPTSPFQPGNSQRLSGQVSGGTDRMQYFVSSSYNNEVGVLGFPSALRTLTQKLLNGNPIPGYADKPNLLNSVSISSNVTTQFNRGDLAFASNGVRQYHRDVPEGTAGFISAAQQSPGYLDTLTYGWGSTTPANNFLTRNDETTNHGYGSLSGNWRPASQVIIHGVGGIDLANNDAQVLLTQNDVLPGISSNSSKRNRAQTTNFVKTFDGNVTWTQPFNQRFQLVSTGGAQYAGTSTSAFNVNAYSLPLGSSTISGAGGMTSTEYSGQQVTAGWYLQEVANLNQRLFLTGAIRADASSSFGSSKPVAYPKWNASWLISQEPFFPSIPGVSSFRLRMGFGHAGTQPSYDARFKTYQYLPGVADGTVQNTIGINTVGNPDLQPEKSVETEGGFDLSLGDDRLTLGVTFENKMTQNALVNRSLPLSLGVASSQYQNIGRVANHSFEFDLTAHPIDLPIINWTSSLSFAHQTNRLITLNSNTAAPFGAGSGNLVYYLPGYPIDAVWARSILGYNDVNGDGFVQSNELKLSDSLSYAGRAAPPTTMGWQNSVALWSGRVTIGGNFTYENGATQTNGVLRSQCSAGRCQGAVDQDASLSDQILAQSVNLTAWSYLEQVSVFRFNELTMTVTAPPSLARALRAQNASISLLGRNLKVWSHYRGADPDVNSSPSGDAVVDNGTVPQPRAWYLRVRLGF